MFTWHFSVIINAPVEKVWDIMISPEWYRARTAPFNPAWSWFEWDWNKWSMIRFLWPHPHHPEKIWGMLSEIEDNRRYEYIGIKHIGEIHDWVVVTKEPLVDAYERYSFNEVEGVTTLKIEINFNMNEESAKYMSEAWPKALKVLKDLAEKPDEAI